MLFVLSVATVFMKNFLPTLVTFIPGVEADKIFSPVCPYFEQHLPTVTKTLQIIKVSVTARLTQWLGDQLLSCVL